MGQQLHRGRGAYRLAQPRQQMAWSNQRFNQPPWAHPSSYQYEPYPNISYYPNYGQGYSQQFYQPQSQNIQNQANQAKRANNNQNPQQPALPTPQPHQQLRLTQGGNASASHFAHDKCQPWNRHPP